MQKRILERLRPALFTGALALGVLCFGVTGYAMDADDDGNGTYDTAVTLPMQKTVQDSLSGTDETDIYKVEVTKNDYVMFVFASESDSAYFTIEDASKSYVASRYVGTAAASDQYQYIKKLSPGTYYIKADNNGRGSGAYALYVTDQQPTSITISQSSLTLEDNSSSQAQLQVEVLPKGCITPEIKWTSGDVFTARVSNEGLVRANGLGCTQITATSEEYPNLKATCDVAVTPRQVASIYQDTSKTKKNKLAVSCSMGYSAAKMPDGYHFYLYDKKSGKYVLKGKTTKSEYTFKGLKAETGYKIRVCAYINTPNGQAEGVMSETKTLYTAPKQLKGCKITGIEKKQRIMKDGYPARVFNLKWKKVKGASAYKVYGQTKAGEKFVLMSTTKKPVANLYAGIGFTYKVYVVPVRTKHGVSTDGKKSAQYTVDMRE